MTTAKALQKMLHGYMVAALWSSTDENDEPLDAHFSPSDFDAADVAKMTAECSDFLEHNATDIEEFLGKIDESMEQVGHDFWLTRNRHGVGFWDRGAGAVGARLTKAAHIYGSCDLYVGDDGMVHVS